MKFDIFGGCTSRDLFNFENACGSVNRYFARSSLVSQYTPKVLSLQTAKFDTGSNFTNRMVRSDIEKSFRHYLSSSSPKGDYLIMDLLIERVPILRFENGYITRSIEFLKAKLDIGRETRLSKDEHLSVFREIAPTLANDLKCYKKVFLHKAFARNSYIDKNQKIARFDNLEEIESMNIVLAALYKTMEESMSNLVPLALNDFCAWEGHRWGLSPYHYEDEYYQLLNKRINNIIQSDGTSTA